MPGALAVAGQDTADFAADRLGVGVQNGRVHVALQRDAVAYALAGFANVAGPVQAQGVGTGVGDAFQPQAAALGEENDRYFAAFMFANQAADDLAHVGQGEFLIRRRRKVAAPGVENLHGLGAGHDLAVEVSRD